MNTYTKLTRIVGLVMSAAIILSACAPAATPTVAPTAAPPTSVPATPVPPTIAPTAAPQLKGDAIRGGRLYDKWWTVLSVDAPTKDQPLWKTQTTNKLTGADTWRCKECHGWDYKGVEGAYGSGSHKTGFKGVMGVAGKDANAILAILKGSVNPDHNFSSVMNDQALIDLSLFLSSGLIDVSTIVASNKSPVNGNATKGKATYTDNCDLCHGPQGTAINFKNDAGAEYVGTIGLSNPWEFLHKARFSQPGVSKMPSGVNLKMTTQDYADLLLYVQSLPASSPVTEGGRLYDKWSSALGVTAPTQDQPLWKTQTTNKLTGADTWRCKECHGWDYKGVDGAYASGSHKTGFKGISKSVSMSAEDLTAWLTGKKNPNHDFSAYLKEAQIKMLIAFVQKGMTDTTPYIQADKKVKGDSAKGKTPYTAACASCHGDDGKSIAFGAKDKPEYVGTVANSNPWEFWHKVSVGQPGKQMPAAINLGWTPENIANVLAYSQTLPQK